MLTSGVVLLDKIVILTHNFYPESVGGASRIYEMVKVLKQSYEVNIVCPPPTYPFTKYKKVNYLFKKENIDGSKVFRLWTFQPTRQRPSFIHRILYYMVFPVFASIFLVGLLRNTSFFIVSTPPALLLITTLGIRIFNKKLILDVRDLWVDAASSLGYVNKNNLFAKILKKFEVYCWKKSDMIITNSMVIGDVIKQTLSKQSSSKIKYFPFNVDINVFKRIDVKREKQIVYIGNFGVAQNLEALINAMPIVLESIPDLKVQLYGGGDVESNIKKLVLDLNLDKSFTFNNPVPRAEIPSILSRSLLGIIPLAGNEALRYAIPTKTFEYLACSLPVIAYGVSEELERVIRESDAGICIKSTNPVEIANMIIGMLNEASMVEKYSTNGRKFVEKQISFPIIT